MSLEHIASLGYYLATANDEQHTFDTQVEALEWLLSKVRPHSWQYTHLHGLLIAARTLGD